MKSITICNLEEDYPKAAQMVGDTLNFWKINRVVRTETMMIFEALYHNLQEKLGGSTVPITLTAKQSLGDQKIILGFEGGMMDPMDSGAAFSPETQILKTYSDKFVYSYRYGYNRIEIDVRKSFQMTQIVCLIAAAVAVIAYFLMRENLEPSVQQGLLNNLIVPLEQLFANAVVMIAAPVTFFSLLKNQINASIVAEWNSTVKRLYRNSMISSVISVLLAIFAALIVSNLLSFTHDLLANAGTLQIKFTIKEIISNLVPSNIFEPFITISPFPLIILTLMVAYSLFSTGKHFDLINQLSDAAYVVFARMLGMIMFTLPFFLVMAFLDVLMNYGVKLLIFLPMVLVLVLASLLLLLLFYAVRLGVFGINPFHFLKQVIPLLKENYLINSSLDAVPYNIRWCVQNLKLNRKKLQESMPVMAQINLDGNCFLITLTALIFISVSGTGIDLFHIGSIGVLVLFLSMGAPNQPGSCLIGMLIIFYHMDAPQLMPLALFTEVMFGGMQNLINVLGDIVTIVVDDARIKKSKERKERAKSKEEEKSVI